MIAISADPGRWFSPQPGVKPAAQSLLRMLNEPSSVGAEFVKPAQDGEHTFLVSALPELKDFVAQAISLQVHYIYMPPDQFGWPGRTWVESVEGVYPLT